MQQTLKKITTLPKIVSIFFIRIYQKLFSFDHAFWANPDKYRICIYHPSCSEYTSQAIDKHGVIKGSVMGTARIMRCTPSQRGGDDEVPDGFSLKRSKVGI